MTAEGLAVEVSTRVCGASGFYEWRSRAPSARSIRHAWLTDQIIDVHAASRGTYGSRRVHAELTIGRGVQVGYHAVPMLTARAGLQGLPGNRCRRKSTGGPTALDLVDRNFARTEPDQLWVTDITEQPTREGRVYFCVVLDAYSRRVVGWSIDSAQTSTLVTNALGMAISNRRPVPGSGLIIHSDQGVQFTSWAFTRRAQEYGLLPSRGPVGDCFDNAVIESFWGRMQTELLNRRRWRTRGRAGERHVRVPRGLPQPPAPPLGPRDGHPDRV